MTREDMAALMSDIVERLLTMYSHRGDGLPTQYINPDGPEAAESITALRAEAERLREALEKIAADAFVPLDRLPEDDQPNGWRDVAIERINIARATLKGNSNG